MDKLSNDIDRVNERIARAYEEHSSGEKNCYTCKQSIINHAQTGCKKSVMDVCGNTTVPYGAVRWQHWEAKPDKVDKQPDNTLVLHYEFKPCPCCGGKPDFYEDKQLGCHYIQCGSCLIRITDYKAATVFTAVSQLSNRWNTRV